MSTAAVVIRAFRVKPFMCNGLYNHYTLNESFFSIKVYALVYLFIYFFHFREKYHFSYANIVDLDKPPRSAHFATFCLLLFTSTEPSKQKPFPYPWYTAGLFHYYMFGESIYHSRGIRFIL